MIKRFLYIIASLIIVGCSVFYATTYVSLADSNENFQMSGDTLVRYTGDDTEIVIPSNVKAIGNAAFTNNHDITKVTFGDNVEVIEANAFSGCDGLKRVILTDSIIEIGDSAFANCINLDYVYMGSGVNTIGKSAFLGCSKLKDIEVSPKNLCYTCLDGCLFNASRTELICVLAGRDKEYLIINSLVEKIDPYAFWGCDAVKHVSVPNNVTDIPEYAFANSGVVSVALPFNVESIGPYAFSKCSRLEQVYVPDKTTTIYDNIFENSPNAYIYTKSGTYAEEFAKENGIRVVNNPIFDLDYARSVKEKTVNNVTPSNSGVSDLKDVTFGIIDRDFNAINSGNVLGSTVVVNGKAVVMLDQKKINVISGPSVVHNDTIRDNILDGILKEKQFYRKADVRNVQIPSECKGIGRFCFARSGITSINIPEGVETIEYAAFYHCDNLEQVSIPSTVTKIEEHAFEFTPFINNWKNGDDESDYLIVGDGILLAYKCADEDFSMPANVKSVACEIPQK